MVQKGTREIYENYDANRFPRNTQLPESKADINGEHIFVGSESIFEKSNERSIEYTSLKNELESQKSMLAFIGINSIPVGAVVFSDKIRNGVKSMVEATIRTWN